MSGVCLQIRGVTWHFLNFMKRLPIEMRVFELTSIIVDRHGGSVTDLTLYKDEVHPRNVLNDPMRTLNEIEFVVKDVGGEREVVLYYDFAPHHSDCPLLLCAPRNFRIEAQEREKREEEEKRKAKLAALTGDGKSASGQKAASGKVSTLKK